MEIIWRHHHHHAPRHLSRPLSLYACGRTSTGIIMFSADVVWWWWWRCFTLWLSIHLSIHHGYAYPSCYSSIDSIFLLDDISLIYMMNIVTNERSYSFTTTTTTTTIIITTANSCFLLSCSWEINRRIINQTDIDILIFWYLNFSVSSIEEDSFVQRMSHSLKMTIAFLRVSLLQAS